MIYGTLKVNDIPCPVVQMIDAYGEDTDSVEECAVAVVQVNETVFINVDGHGQTFELGPIQ